MELLTLAVGAILGVCADRFYSFLSRMWKKRNPLHIEVKKSHVPPMWFATNEQPPSDNSKASIYENRVIESAAFCGFAKINLRITNSSKETVYLTDIQITKQKTTCQFKYRVRTIPQGVSTATRLFAFLDDENCFFSSSLTKRFEKNGHFFLCGNKIKIAPGESEDVYLVFATLEHAWRINCDIEYSISSKTKWEKSVFIKELLIVPYHPQTMTEDYCAFLKIVDPDYPEFDDACFFTEEMKKTEQQSLHKNVNSSLSYLESILE